MSKSRVWVAAIASAMVFFGLLLITNPLHDAIFLSHTSIQDGVSSCSPYTQECDSEDQVRAYNSKGWALLGNSIAILTTIVRVLLAYAAFVLIRGRGAKRG